MQRLGDSRTISRIIEIYQERFPEWCGECEFGLVNPPPIRIGQFSRLDVRLYQAIHGLLTFCDCPDGTHYREMLMREHNRRQSGRSRFNLTPSEHMKLTAYVEAQARGEEPEYRILRDDKETITENVRMSARLEIGRIT